MNRRATRRFALLLLLLASLAPAGCRSAPGGPEYARPLAPGASALEKVRDPAAWPDLEAVYAGRDADLRAALERSLAWFETPSSRRFYPMEGVSHARARASVAALAALLENAPDAASFEHRVRRQFDLYRSVGWDGAGAVLFTGYYAPVFSASPVRTERFRYPVYARPEDLVSDPETGEVKGRRVGRVVVDYPTRRRLVASGMLEGLALYWFERRLDAYRVEVNGSARLQLPDGETVHIGYAGSNGHPYTSIGRRLVARGAIPAGGLTMQAIEAWAERHPGQLERLILENDRFVFFREYEGERWPAGSLGIPVTPWRTVATDKSIFPRGGAVIAETRVPDPAGGTRPATLLMLDQDTGGAIRAAGRADLYIGVGAQAGALAGRQHAEGRLFYLWLKTTAEFDPDAAQAYQPPSRSRTGERQR